MRRQQLITLEQVRSRMHDAEVRRDAALRRSMRGKSDFDYQVRLAVQAQSDYETWKKVYDSLKEQT